MDLFIGYTQPDCRVHSLSFRRHVCPTSLIQLSSILQRLDELVRLARSLSHCNLPAQGSLKCCRFWASLKR